MDAKLVCCLPDSFASSVGRSCAPVLMFCVSLTVIDGERGGETNELWPCSRLTCEFSSPFSEEYQADAADKTVLPPRRKNSRLPVVFPSCASRSTRTLFPVRPPRQLPLRRRRPPPPISWILTISSSLRPLVRPRDSPPLRRMSLPMPPIRVPLPASPSKAEKTSRRLLGTSFLHQIHIRRRINIVRKSLAMCRVACARPAWTSAG